jgi:hypothetical protein
VGHPVWARSLSIGERRWEIGQLACPDSPSGCKYLAGIFKKPVNHPIMSRSAFQKIDYDFHALFTPVTVTLPLRAECKAI